MKLDPRYSTITSDESTWNGDPKAVEFLPSNLKEIAKRAQVGATNPKMTVVAPDENMTWQEGVRIAAQAKHASDLTEQDLMARLEQSYVGKIERMKERGMETQEFPDVKTMSGLGQTAADSMGVGAQLATAAAAGLTAAQKVLSPQQPAPEPEDPKVLGVPVKWLIVGAGLGVVGMMVWKGRAAARRKRRRKK